jgi:tetratricopeptide (TPR) repeat protein
MGKQKWYYLDSDGAEPVMVDDALFAGMMQEYCYSFYALGTPSSYEAFLSLSQRMNEHFPKNADFLGNIGSYHMVVKHDYKTALKYYDKALKVQPGSKSILHNAILACRKMQNSKLEKKYQKQLGE